MKNKHVAVIQARMGSSRLPGKVLMPILDKPVLWHIVNRLSKVPMIDEVVVATSDLDRDAPIRLFCRENRILCFQGNEADVLDRFYNAALSRNADTVLRITGDCPLVDPALIKTLIDLFHADSLEYCGVAAGAGVSRDEFHGRYPDGLDAEIFSFAALKKAWEEADGILYREHVTPYMWKHPEIFNAGVLKCSGKDYGRLRWTLDNPEDYHLIKNIYEKLFPENPAFGMEDILGLMEKDPLIFEANQHFVGKEGYEQFWN